MVNRVKGSSNYLDNWEKRREKKKNRIIYLGSEAKLDKGLKEILKTCTLAEWQDWMMVEKDGRREGDKGTVSSSDTCFSIYHL